MIETRSELGELTTQWDQLAHDCGSLFMTSTWLASWWRAFGEGGGVPVWVLNRDTDGSLLGGTMVMRCRGRLESASNVHSGDWNVLARDERAREEVWRAIARMSANRIRLEGLPAGREEGRSASEQLEQTGYRVFLADGPASPWVDLPASWEDFMGSVNSSLRRQVGRRRRGLEREGTVTYRTQSSRDGLSDALDRFFVLEAAGWKGENGTAISSRPDTVRLYRDFAHAAADRGMLRLHLLELDGTLIAASYDCVYAGVASLLKTTFSEPHGRLSPGLVLLAEVLRACVEEGVSGYDFLGDADHYKMRWASEVRPRSQAFGYRGSSSLGYEYRKVLRPALKSARDRLAAPVRSRRR